MAHLRFLDDAGRLDIRALDAERFVIGRAATCQLVFESDMISREHLCIQLETDGRFRVRDLESRNKTYVNGELITDTLLSAGDVIRAGDRVLEFIDDSAAVETVDKELLARDRGEPPNVEWIKADAPIPVTHHQLGRLAAILVDQPLLLRAEDIAEAALSQIVLETQAERGLIALRADDELVPLAHRGLARAPASPNASVNQAFAVAPLLHAVAGRYPQSSNHLNQKLGYAATAITAPLRHQGTAVGVLYLDRVSAKKSFGLDALHYAAATGAYLGSLMNEAAHRLKAFAPREGLAWMNSAKRIQRLLTNPLATTGAIDVCAKTVPGRLRCGTVAEVVPIDEQRCAILVVHGSGHGVVGIAHAHAIRAAFRAALCVSTNALRDPAPIFALLNRTLFDHRGRQEIPCLFLGIDLKGGTLSYINAGLPQPYLLAGPGQVISMDRIALTPGADPEYVYDPIRIDLPSKFRLVSVSHGLIEAANAGGEPFSTQRLLDLVMEKAFFDAPATMLTRLAQSVQTHLAETQPEDDALLLVAGHG